MRAALLLSTSAFVVLTGLACGGLGAPAPVPAPGPGPTPSGGAQVPPAPVVDPLINPAGQRIVDTSIARNSGAYFPLAEGLELTYDEIEDRGAGDRVLFMTDRPRKRRKRGEWRFKVDGVDTSLGEPVYLATLTRPSPAPEELDAKDEPTTESYRLRLWVDGDRVKVDGFMGEQDAIAIQPGPPVVDSEEVVCQLWFLGGVVSTCAPIGGLGGDAIGQEVISLDYKNDLGNAVSRTFVGLVTLGTIIPGSKRRTFTLRRTAMRGLTPTRELPAFYQAWQRAQPRGEAVDLMTEIAKTTPPDPASLAVIASSDGMHIEARTQAAMELLPVGYRAPVLREAIRALPDGERRRVRFVGAFNGAIRGLPIAHRGSVEELLGERSLRMGALLDAGSCPSFAAAVAEPDSVGWSAAVRLHMAGDLAQPSCDEAAMGLASEDERSAEILDLVLAAQPPDRWVARLTTGLRAVSDDDTKAEILRRHLDRAKSASASEKASIVDAFTFDDGQDTARSMLGLPALDAAE